jgi:hypothetical protein
MAGTFVHEKAACGSCVLHWVLEISVLGEWNHFVVLCESAAYFKVRGPLLLINNS